MNEGTRLLVVDDEPDILETLKFALERRGFQVECASDGAAAYNRATANPPDLVLLDVMLPRQNGYEISRRLKEWMDGDAGNPRFPIALLTARTVDSHEREEFVSTWSRADAVFYKPFPLEELVARIHQLVERGEGAQLAGAGHP